MSLDGTVPKVERRSRGLLKERPPLILRRCLVFPAFWLGLTGCTFEGLVKIDDPNGSITVEGTPAMDKGKPESSLPAPPPTVID